MDKDDPDDYFSSYEDLEVHHLMLKDQPRIRAYQNFIEGNKLLFKDKTVMDVGAGMGILSLLVARAGAKQVFAVEASGVYALCKEIIIANRLEDQILVLHGCVEEVRLPGDVKVDVIISEWMGFYLLHESMLNSVIAARNQHLKPDGIMVPSAVNLYLCPVSMTDFYNEHIRFWNNVCGFSFSPAVPHVKRKLLTSPQIECLTSGQCLANPERVLSISLKYVDPDDVRRIFSLVNFKMTKNGLLHGLACWFDVEFDGDVPTVLNTGPDSDPTHWKQTVILLPDVLLVNKNEEFQCQFIIEQSTENPRRYNISIEVPEDVDEDENGIELEEAARMLAAAVEHDNK